MRKSEQQILKEYNSKGALERLGIQLRDNVAILGNGLSFGLANRVAQGVTGASDEALENYEREQRIRTGLMGDVANVAGMLVGGKGVLSAGRGAIKAARAAPTAARLATTAGPATAARYLTGRAGPGLVPVAAPVSRAAMGKGALGALGGLGLVGYSAAGRMDDTPTGAPAAEPAVVTEAVDQALAQPAGDTKITAQDRAMDAINAILARPHTMREFQAATAALPGVAASTAGKQSDKDKVFGTAMGISEALYQYELEQIAQKLTGDAKDQAVLAATEKYRRNLLETVGADPLKQAVAEAAQAAGE